MVANWDDSLASKMFVWLGANWDDSLASKMFVWLGGPGRGSQADTCFGVETIL